VCDACQQKAEADPLALLLALLKRAKPEAQPGPNIPDYEIERKLGQGGMGAVYLARHKVRGTRVALKVLLSKVAVSKQARQRFMREIESTRELRHRNVVEFYDQGSAGGAFYFLLEYCRGGSLEDLRRKRGGRLSLDEAGAFVHQALDGLAYVHQQGFVHRDLKPHNILLNNGQGRWTAKVADLGIAKYADEAGFSGMTATGTYAGSYPFMPREQLTNFKYSKPVSDVWAMGATLYYLLAGQGPYSFQRGQDPVAVILKGAVVPIRKRIPRIPRSVAEVIDRALVVDTKDRYQDAAELRRALEKVL
jgi:serine/threonine protein kinase